MLSLPFFFFCILFLSKNCWEGLGEIHMFYEGGGARAPLTPVYFPMKAYIQNVTISTWSLPLYLQIPIKM